MDSLDIVVCGRTITSFREPRHTCIYRTLLRALAARGHRVTFLERRRAADARFQDLEPLPYCDVHFYEGVDQLRDRFSGSIRRADLVLVGSGLEQGVEINRWVLSGAGGIRAFYDLDGPTTLESAVAGDCPWLEPAQAAEFDLYLTCTGGPLLGHLERRLGVRSPRTLYPSADPLEHHSPATQPRYDLGYMGEFCPHRQRSVKELLLEPAVEWSEGHFLLAGSGYPEGMRLPRNMDRRDDVPLDEHDAFHGSQRFTLIATPQGTARMGHCPDIRLMEAAARGTPVISDRWNGISSFFTPGEEILVVRSPREVLEILRLMPEARRLAIRLRARKRVLAQHTPDHRAETLESYLDEVPGRHPSRRRRALIRA
jgi:spore maturation protein CgeB